MTQQQPHVILAVHVTDRVKKASAVQALLGKNGGIVRTRLGLHDTGEGAGSPSGVILLELIGPAAAGRALAAKLAAIAGVEVKRIAFSH
ncbi:MAG: hypothetical protein ABFD92_12630 [Planctomycetaceae bacterium]|nr:hypothetical protein [Planctomycetaceae bacterium]